MLPHLAPDAVLPLDDAARPEEATIVERWMDEVEGFELTLLPHEKGTAELRRIP